MGIKLEEENLKDVRKKIKEKNLKLIVVILKI